jgi:hypothetical protein
MLNPFKVPCNWQRLHPHYRSPSRPARQQSVTRPRSWTSQSRTARRRTASQPEGLATHALLLQPAPHTPCPTLSHTPSERRRAKIFNFSIAYGKTAHGLSSRGSRNSRNPPRRRNNPSHPSHPHTPHPVPHFPTPSERRKAKILNFSIAYGKTAHGLAKDFNTSLQEAEETVEKWYSDRAEVGC